MELGSENHNLLEGSGSYRTNESAVKNSQPKVSRMEEGRQQESGVSLIRKTDHDRNHDLEEKNGISFGGFHDGPVRGLGHNSYCKRRLELAHECNKRQRYMDNPDGGIEKLFQNRVLNSVCLRDEELGIRNSCNPNGHHIFDSYVTETSGDLYNTTGMFKSDITPNTALSHGQNELGESYDIVTGSVLPLRLKDDAKRLEPLSSFPVADGGNYLLGEPLRDIISDARTINHSKGPTLINNKDENNLLLLGIHDKENVIDPRVIFKFDANSRNPGEVKRICNSFPGIQLPQEDKTVLGCLDTNENSRIGRNASKQLPLIGAVDESILPPQKNTIIFTYPTPDRVCDREFNTHIYNKTGSYSSDTIEQEQKGLKKPEKTKPGPKNKPKLSQKLLYIHNLSRSSNTKIDETVAYLHYKLRGYENMAVLTRIRNILQSHQLNLIGICSQLGIPELLVPRRTN